VKEDKLADDKPDETLIVDYNGDHKPDCLSLVARNALATAATAPRWPPRKEVQHDEREARRGEARRRVSGVPS
jgi:hypothetical protein